MSAPALVASERNIDVWIVFEDSVDESLLGQLRGLMSESEEAQARRFHFAADRKRYAITRGLVRTTLSRYAPVAPSDWTFTANLYGRPAVAESHKAAAGLIFNISHTLGMIVLAVTRNLELGVDVENTVSRHVSIGIAERFFAPTEVAALARVPHHQRQARFFEYWTFKESYIKARGMGLSIPLDRFSFHYPHERGVLLAIEPELRDDPERWCLWQLRPTRQHVLALCATRHPRGIPDLTIRRVLPAVQEELLDPPIYRTSEIDPALVPALARLA